MSKQSQQDLVGVTDIFRSFMDHTPLLACIKDRDAVIRYANRAWIERLGRPASEIIGQAERDLYPAEQAERFGRTDRRVFEQGDSVELTEQGSLIDGRPSWWHVIKFPIDLSDGDRLLGMFALDVTDRVRTQTALAASEAQAKAVLDTAVDAIITIDTRGTVRSFNIAAAQMFGYTPAEVIGQNVRMLMPEPYHSEHDDYLRRYLATGEARIIGIGREVTARHKSGDEFPIDLAVSEVIGGGEHEFTGIIKNLSEQRRTQAELEQRNEETRNQREQLAHLTRVNTLGEMAAGIAHEINQPLAAIATYAQACQRLLRNAQPDVPALLDTLEKVARQAQRGGDIIRRVRDLAQPARTRRLPLQINDAVHECVEMAAYQARVNGIRFDLDLASRLAPVHADPIQIQQVMLNLIRNSLDALQESPDGCIAISTAAHPGTLEIVIRDNGPGIDPATAARLFEHFVTTKPAGMGIGLSISRTIIEAHGGSLVHEPDPAGAVFRISLPLEVAA